MDTSVGWSVTNEFHEDIRNQLNPCESVVELQWVLYRVNVYTIRNNSHSKFGNVSWSVPTVFQGEFGE